MARRPPREPQESGGNPLALAVLALLWESPMHPYEMSRTLKERHKDESVRLNYGSLYSIIETLAKNELVETAGTEQAGNRPVRTIYRITERGSVKLQAWLSDLVARPVKEYPQFMAALSFLPVLDPDEVQRLLTKRVEQLRAKVAALTEQLDETTAMLPELFSIESEYELALTTAERDFVEKLLQRVETGALKGVRGWRKLHEIIRRTGRGPTTGDLDAAFAEEGITVPPRE